MLSPRLLRAHRPKRAGSLALGAALLFAACTGEIGDRQIDGQPVAIDPAPSTLHRLTRAQYANSIHDLLGKELAIPTALEPDVASGGITSVSFASVGSSIGSVSRRGIIASQ